jgi:hypothetical protein
MAVPMWNLMIAGTPAGAATGVAAPANDVAEIAQSEDNGSSVSALMAGSTVGPVRGCILAPRHPASAFVP